MPSSLWLTDCLADDAADGSTASGANGASVRKEVPPDGTSSSVKSGILVLPGHPGTSHWADQHGRGHGAAYAMRLHRGTDGSWHGSAL